MLGRHCLIFICISVFAISIVLASDPTKIQQYGHHVSVRVEDKHLCSGSIIASRFILTSRWCITFYESNEYITVVAGTKSLEIFGDTYQIEKVILSNSPFNDIAILRTRNDIIFHDDIRSIPISFHRNYEDDYELSYTGWESSDTGEKREILQLYTAQLYNKTACEEEPFFSGVQYMCIHNPSGTEVSNKESGGAIVANGIQIGIYIDKDLCRDINRCTKHTPLEPYMNWIRENMKLADDTTPHAPIEVSKPDEHPGSYAHHVSIRNNDEHVCSGSIISERHILTSINCIMRYTPKTLMVMVGINSLNERGDTYQVEAVERHPGYRYDIAIMKLRTKIAFNDLVQPIRIVESGREYGDSRNTILTGWARDDPCGPISDKLQQILMKTINTRECRQMIPFLNTLYMCSMAESSHTCNIDYGSPIVSNGVQIALKPWGVGCGEKSDPHLHLPLGKVAKWIKRHSRVRK